MVPDPKAYPGHPPAAINAPDCNGDGGSAKQRTCAHRSGSVVAKLEGLAVLTAGRAGVNKAMGVQHGVRLPCQHRVYHGSVMANANLPFLSRHLN